MWMWVAVGVESAVILGVATWCVLCERRLKAQAEAAIARYEAMTEEKRTRPPILVDPSIPRGEVHLRQGNVTVGKITNLADQERAFWNRRPPVRPPAPPVVDHGSR